MNTKLIEIEVTDYEIAVKVANNWSKGYTAVGSKHGINKQYFTVINSNNKLLITNKYDPRIDKEQI